MSIDRAKLTGAVRQNPKRFKARATKDDAPPVGEPPQKWMIFHPDIGYQEAEKLRTIWDNCCRLWPWMQQADRDDLEQYCRLKLKDDKGTIKGPELTAMLRIRSYLVSGANHARRSSLNLPGNTQPAKAAARDPREKFLASKVG